MLPVAHSIILTHMCKFRFRNDHNNASLENILLLHLGSLATNVHLKVSALLATDVSLLCLKAHGSIIEVRSVVSCGERIPVARCLSALYIN